MGDRILKVLTEGVVLKNNFQKLIHDFMNSKLSQRFIHIRNIEHSPYKEIYYLVEGPNSAQVEMNYNNDLFVTSIALVSYSDARMQSQLREILKAANAS